MQFMSAATSRGAVALDGLRPQLKNETMFFGASCAFIQAADNADITKAVLGRAIDVIGRQHEEHIVIDTRVHMLMPGWYPCIPGWHHDDVARTRGDGQPDYQEQPYLSRHVLLVLNSHIAPTEFAVGLHALPEVPLGQKVYQTWNPLVERQIEAGTLTRVQVKDSELYEFDWQTMHRGVAAVASGWRYFFRATVRAPRHRNEIRRQVQVYVPGDINQGC